MVAGGGIGGMAATLACARQGWAVQVHEQSRVFSEVGAGVQLGPNVTRRLAVWGLADALQQAAAEPQRLVVRSAPNHAVLAQRPLASAMRSRYGAPYLTIHRAALHQVLLRAVQAQPQVVVHTGSPVAAWPSAEADVLIAADGLWSQLRASVIGGDTPPQPTGHVAYRALWPQADLPAALRSDDVTVWLGPRLHVVRYPVRDPASGALALNLVLVVHVADVPALAGLQRDAARWDHDAMPGEWQVALGGAHAALREVLHAMPRWQRWVLHDRPPLTSAAHMARDRVALLGDAAHPMRPYLAQGAGMAIEDAFALEQALARRELTVPEQLARYAQARWQRNAQVQARSRRNGRIFHAEGPLRLGRDLALRMLGAPLLDQPWLYSG